MSRAEPTVTQTVYSQSEHYEFGYMYPDSSALLSLFTVKHLCFVSNWILTYVQAACHSTERDVINDGKLFHAQIFFPY